MYLLQWGLVRWYQVQETAEMRRTRGIRWNSASWMIKAQASFQSLAPYKQRAKDFFGGTLACPKDFWSLHTVRFSSSWTTTAGPTGHQAPPLHTELPTAFLNGHLRVTIQFFNIINQVVKCAMKKNSSGVKGMGVKEDAILDRAVREASLKRWQLSRDWDKVRYWVMGKTRGQLYRQKGSKCKGPEMGA